MNIPTAEIITINVKPAVIITDNSENIINTNTEAIQLINQIAFLEVCQVGDTQREVDYDRDTLRMNLCISSSITNNPNPSVPRSLTLPTSRIEVFEYDDASTLYSRGGGNRNRRHPNGRNNPEGKIFVGFLFVVVLIIIVFTKSK